MVLTLQTRNALQNKTTPQGLAIFNGVSMFAGVLPYTFPNEDGTSEIAGVVSLPEDLFNESSLSTIVGTGIYIEHPSDFTENLDNAVGIVLSATPSQDYDPTSDSVVYFVKLSLAVWDSDAIQFINSGNRELSAGYTATFQKQEGIWYGSPYQYKKTDIVYNHLAILPQGTARNGSYSQITDSTKTKKILVSQLSIVDSRYVNQSAESLLNDSVEKSSEVQVSMKKFLLSTGDYIEIAESSESILTDFISKFSEIKNQVEDSKAIISDRDALKLKVADTETKVAELTQLVNDKDQLIAESQKQIKRAATIAFKAEKLGVSVDLDNFNADELLKQTLVANGYKVEDDTPISALEYAFAHIQIPVAEIPTTAPTKDSKKTSTGITTKHTPLKSAVENSGQVLDSSEEDFSAEAMAQASFKSRQKRTTKK